MDFISPHEGLRRSGHNTGLKAFLLATFPVPPLTAEALQSVRADTPAADFLLDKEDGVTEFESVTIVRGEFIARRDDPFTRTITAVGFYLVRVDEPIGIIGLCRFNDPVSFFTPANELAWRVVCMSQKTGLGE